MDRELWFLSESPEATEALGAELARHLGPGTVLALHGELGAGKTCLVRGLARGLGIPGPVASPTYLLLQEYPGGRLPLAHYDAWMEGREKALLLDGGAEALGGAGIAVVEWAERVADWLPLPRLELELCHAGPERRRLRLVALDAAGRAGEPAWLDDLRLPCGVSETSPPGGG